MSQTVIPILRMTDSSTSLSFYINGLGFDVDWEHRHAPGLPVFAQLTRSTQSIFLTEHAEDCQVGGAVHFVVADVDACYQAFKASGEVECSPPHNTAWKTRDLLVIDPDGNRLTFSTELSG